MNSKAVRAREYYGYALVAGMTVKEARRQLLGFILDCYMIRMKYDAQLAGAKLSKRMLG